MNQGIKKNELNDTVNDEMILKFRNSFKKKACISCLENNEEYLFKCNNCGYYFCNNNHRKTSHILIHLRKCNHNKICLSPFFSEIRCEKCKETNIFELKYSKSKKGKLSILCKSCSECKNNYTNIVGGEKINEEILLSPEVPPLANREDSFSESINAHISNKILSLEGLCLQSVKPNYFSKDHYYQIYSNLIKEEIEAIEKENEEDPFFVFNLKFTYLENGDNIAEIINCFQHFEKFQFYLRQLLIITKVENEEKQFIGKVINKENNKVTIYIYSQDSKKRYIDGPYKIKEKYTTKNYETMLDGLDKFKAKSNLIDKDLEALIIGFEKDNISNVNEYFKNKEVPTRLNILDLNVRLNPSQEYSIKNCFKHKLNIIKGSPGTGKTTVLVNLAYHLVNHKNSIHKILICASSNRAVENISILLSKIKDLKFVRVLSREKELNDDVETINSLYTLAKQNIESNPKKNKKIISLIQKREKYGLKKSEEEEYRNLMEEFEERILSSSDIILSTINNSADSRLKDYYFPIVIIDEGTQALEPDNLLPLYHRAEMVVLFGDEKQLGPIVISREAKVARLDISLFERLCYYYEDSDFIITLNEQYRMHEFLYRFSNDKFYNNNIISKTSNILDENVMNNFPWPDKAIPSLFYHYTYLEESENNSYFNKIEIYLIYGFVKKLTEAGVHPYDIGIITAYNAQKFRLCERFSRDKRYEKLRIESVDGFQGMEKKYIIISTVRSNEDGNIGFLSSEKRLNVALTRAKNGLIILGNCQTLSRKAGIWRDLIDFYYSKKLIVKGPLDDLELVLKEEILSSKKYFESDGNEMNIQRKEKKYFNLINSNRHKNEIIKDNNNFPAPPIKPIVDNVIVPNNSIIHNKNNTNSNNIINKIEKKKEQNNEQQNAEKVNKNKNKKKHIVKEVEKEKGNKKYKNKKRSKKNKNDKEENKKQEKEINNEIVEDKKDIKKKSMKIKDKKIREKKSKK